MSCDASMHLGPAEFPTTVESTAAAQPGLASGERMRVGGYARDGIPVCK